MGDGQEWETGLEALCYVSSTEGSRMNEDSHENGGSFVETENPQLHKDEAEKSSVKNLEEEETYIQGEGMGWLAVAVAVASIREEQKDGVTLSGLGHSPVLNKAKVHKGKEVMMETTTLDAPNDVPAVDFSATEAGEGSGGHGNGGDGEKDGSFTEKENTQLENEDTQMEDSVEENGDDDLGVEERLPSLDDGFYEVEAIRRKRYRKGKLEYFVKWLGWGEAANTWEPPDNLVGVPEIIEAFENGLLKSTKHRKHKRKDVVHQTQLKKRVERSATPYSLRCLKTSSTSKSHSHVAANNHSAPASLSEQPGIPHIPDFPAFPQTVLFADEVENNDDGRNLQKDNHAYDNKIANPSEEVPRNNEEKEYDPKLSELKATTTNENEADKLKAATTNGNDTDNLAVQVQEAKVPTGETSMSDQPMAVCTELSSKRKAVSTEPVQNGTGRSRGRPRKSISVKRFKIDSCADEPGNTQIPNSAPVGTAEPEQTGVTDNTQIPNPAPVGTAEPEQTGVTDNAAPSSHTAIEPVIPACDVAPSSHTVIEPVKPACDIVKIIKPVGFTPAVASTTQDVLVSFEALRSDGSEVVVDNNHLKTYHPILLIDFYEQHLRYTPKPV